MNDENERKKRTDEGKLVNKEIHSISKEEVSSGMKRMQNGKVVGPEKILMELWMFLGEREVDFLTKLLTQSESLVI